MPESITNLKNTFAEDRASFLQHEGDFEALEQLRLRWMGRKGIVTLLYEQLKSVSKEDRPVLGKAIHELKTTVEAALAQLKEDTTEMLLRRQLTQSLDVSLPTLESVNAGAGGRSVGSLHPISIMQDRLLSTFNKMGFQVYEGPELEYDYYNFEALNIPEQHPARDMQDTFFLRTSGSDAKSSVLRTHTSNVQIHRMLDGKRPFRFVAPGRVYRVDNDATHTPMFHQLECVVVDKHIHMGHLKGILDLFLQDIFGSAMQTRLRPAYFPFVEPGAEVDMLCSHCSGKGCRICKQSGWLEIGGSGMIHPKVFAAVGLDAKEWSGFAFGFGLDRMAMLAYGLADLRQMFEGDGTFEAQYAGLFPPLLTY